MVAPVDESARMYATIQDVSARLDVREYPRYDLEKAIRSATRRCEAYCRRVFTRVPADSELYETRHFLGTGLPMLDIDDLLTLDSITIEGSSVDTDDLLLMPFGKTPTTWLEYKAGGTWTERADVALSGAWGYSETVPWDIWDSIVALVARAIQQAKAGYQDASAVPELGELVYNLSLPHGVRETWDMLKRRVV